MKKLLAALIIFSMPLIAVEPLYSNSNIQDMPEVIKAVAPKDYPVLAKAASAEGKVKVELKINAAGEVISAKMIEGHQLLQEASESAALQWRFVPATGKSKERTAQITFTFIHWTEVEESKRGTISFVPPYEIEIVAQVPHISRHSN